MFKIINHFIEYYIPSNSTAFEHYLQVSDPKTISDIEKLIREYPSSTGLYQ